MHVLNRPRRIRSKGHITLMSLVACLLAAGPRPTLADTAVAWGDNGFGQLGIGTDGGHSNSLVYVSGLGNNVTAIASGGNVSLAIENGALYAWGYMGNTTIQSTPIPVTGLSNGITAIASRLAIQNGTAYQEVANGTTLVPVAITGLYSGVTAIAGGGGHSQAIQNGAAYAWGDNGYGELGDGTTTSSVVPVAVIGQSSGVTAIAAGGEGDSFGEHSLAIQNGAAYAWGSGFYGQLGNGASGYGADGYGVKSETPVPVIGLTSGVTAIAAGDFHSLAIKDGDVYAWGVNEYGELGTGNTTDSNTPIKVLDLPVDLVSVAAGSDDSYALSSDGRLWVWGDNAFGGLGLGDTTTRLSPTQLFAPAGYKFTAIDTDSESTTAVALIAPVPEPASVSLLIFGIGAMAARRRQWMGQKS